MTLSSLYSKLAILYGAMDWYPNAFGIPMFTRLFPFVKYFLLKPEKIVCCHIEFKSSLLITSGAVGKARTMTMRIR
jgi:hypothetical protein